MPVQHYRPGAANPPRPGTRDITVNGRTITRDAIDREVQYHPAPSIEDGRRQAAVALVVRELLVQRAEVLGVTAQPVEDETAEEACIRMLVERECACPEPAEADCRRYFETNGGRFRTPDMHEVSHILLPAPNDDEALRHEARKAARDVLAELDGDTAHFAEMARLYSRCPSREAGGHLGLVERGQTAPEFERALSRMPVGEISRHPLETRYGFHVVLVHQRQPGKPLPFETVRLDIARYLSEQVYRRAISQYLRVLASQADIRGIDFDAASTPLVQ